MAARWPALVLVPAAVVAMVAVDAGHDRPEDSSTPASLDALGYEPVTAPEDAISSTWFCAGGTADPAGGNADHVVVVANVGEAELEGTVTAFPDREDAEPATEPFTIEGGETLEFRLADLVGSAFAAGLVEVDGGGVVVEHRVEGPTGVDVAPCASQPSDEWYFAAGQTTRDALEVLVFFNPFPDPAVVDVTFRTEEDLREPEEFDGLLVPARSVVAREIGQVVTRRERVSTSVVARSGRVVVDRIMVRDGSEGVEALDVALGTPVPAEVWHSPDGVVSEDITEEFVVYNPGDTAAEVDLVVEPEAGEDGPPPTIEPFALTIPADGFQEVVLNEETRIGDAIDDAGVDVLRHGTRVVSLNGQPVVVERTIIGDPDTGRDGLDIAALAPLRSTGAVAAATPEGAEATLVVQNPAGEQAATVTVRDTTTDATEEVEVPPAGRVDVDLAEAGIDGPVVVESDLPVVVERRLLLDGGQTAQTILVPRFGTTVLPEPVS